MMDVRNWPAINLTGSRLSGLGKLEDFTAGWAANKVLYQTHFY
jgi:hypothetical protein